MTNPYPVPWQAKDDTYQQINGGISEDDWIGLWYKHFTNNPKLAFRDLFYLGYCGKMKDAISPQTERHPANTKENSLYCPCLRRLLLR